MQELNITSCVTTSWQNSRDWKAHVFSMARHAKPKWKWFCYCAALTSSLSMNAVMVDFGGSKEQFIKVEFSFSVHISNSRSITVSHPQQRVTTASPRLAAASLSADRDLKPYLRPCLPRTCTAFTPPHPCYFITCGTVARSDGVQPRLHL